MEPPKRLSVRVQLSPQAEFDISQILDWGEEHFGRDAASRYAELIIQALRDIEADPHRPGTVQRDELPAGVYSYHLALSRDRMTTPRVKRPRHFILYRQPDKGVLQVLRILRDSRDLARHLQGL